MVSLHALKLNTQYLNLHIHWVGFMESDVSNITNMDFLFNKGPRESRSFFNLTPKANLLNIPSGGQEPKSEGKDEIPESTKACLQQRFN
jgi:hypothetical protein